MTVNDSMESFFNYSELFFSRTKRNGVIVSGNSVFQRVSKYNWSELTDKPHNIIRHPEMPRGVFYLLWKEILEQRPIGAYVLNKAKDGTFYWVFAVVIPIENEFLSIRLKPSSALFDLIKKKYAELLGIEQSSKLSPKESFEKLNGEIYKLNYRNYMHFMSDALMIELDSRQKMQEKEEFMVFEKVRKILNSGANLKERCKGILEVYVKHSFAPINLEIQAVKYGDRLSTISIIANQYSDLSNLIKEQSKKFLASCDDVLSQVDSFRFDICTVILQEEMVQFFKDDQQVPLDYKNQEMLILKKISENCCRKLLVAINEVLKVVESFYVIFAQINKLVLAMEIVLLSGKIESAKAHNVNSDISELFLGLASYKDYLKVTLREIDGLVKSLVGNIEEVRDDRRSV